MRFNYNPAVDVQFIKFVDLPYMPRDELHKYIEYNHIYVEDDDLAEAIEEEDIDQIINIVTKNEIDINAYRFYESRPILCTLTWDGFSNNTSLLQTCIDLGADINLVDDDGYSPLLNCIMFDEHDVLKFLLSHGADTSVVSIDDDFTIYMADDDMLKVILEYGIDLSIAKQVHPDNLETLNKYIQSIQYELDQAMGTHSIYDDNLVTLISSYLLPPITTVTNIHNSTYQYDLLATKKILSENVATDTAPITYDNSDSESISDSNSD